MAIRKIVRIDEDKCNGCGDCIPNCAEGALEIVDGKARLLEDRYCDGLGACLGVCPQDAITVIERDAAEFNEEAVEAMLADRATAEPAGHAHAPHGGACPGAALMDFASASADASASTEAAASADAAPSELTQWPVQLMLAPVQAPFFQGADLLLAADCVPFALPDFHSRFLRGRKLLIGCPKLDDSAFYAEKLGQILKANDVRSLTIVHMEVPCCFGLKLLARRALAESGRQIPAEEIVIGIRGDVKERRDLAQPAGAATQ